MRTINLEFYDFDDGSFIIRIDTSVLPCIPQVNDIYMPKIFGEIIPYKVVERRIIDEHEMMILVKKTTVVYYN